MNHDATHCLDYNEEICPKSCYRAQLTKEFSEIDYELPVSWAEFGATKECPMNATATIKLGEITRLEIGTPCLICGESIPVDHYSYVPKICDKCKAAVMHVRAEMESQDKTAYDRLMMGIHHE